MVSWSSSRLPTLWKWAHIGMRGGGWGGGHEKQMPNHFRRPMAAGCVIVVWQPLTTKLRLITTRKTHFLKEPCTLFHFWHTAYQEVLYFVVITASYGSDIHHRCVPSVVNGSAVMDLHRSRSCATPRQSLYGTIFRYIESSATHWK